MEEAEVTNTAPASDAPSTTSNEAIPEQSGAAPDKPKDRNDFIREQVEAKRVSEAERDAKVQRRAPEGQFKRGPGRPSKAEIAAREAAKAKTEVEKPAEKPAVAAAKPVEKPAELETPSAPPVAQGVPNGLRAPFKATFGQLPKEWQEEVARLDKIGKEAADQVGSKHAPDVKFAQELRAEIQPYEMMIRAEGGTPQTAIRDLLRTAAIFRIGTPAQKQGALMQIAKQFNVPLQAAAAPDGQPEGGLPDIAQHPAYQQLAGTVQQLQQNLTQQTQAQTQAQEAANLDAVNGFLAETDGKGSAKHPLDESLQSPFAQEIGLVRQLNPQWDARRVLEKAYENLSWKEPGLRAVILERQEAEKKAKAAQELAAKRQAAVSLRPGAPATAATTSKPQSRSEFLKEQLSGLRA
jgi:hypothetical protein